MLPNPVVMPVLFCTDSRPLLESPADQIGHLSGAVHQQRSTKVIQWGQESGPMIVSDINVTRQVSFCLPLVGSLCNTSVSLLLSPN